MSRTETERTGIPDPEVVSTTQRRRFTSKEKLRILEEADACTESGEMGTLLRREGTYSLYLRPVAAGVGAVDGAESEEAGAEAASQQGIDGGSGKAAARERTATDAAGPSGSDHQCPKKPRIYLD